MGGFISTLKALFSTIADRDRRIIMVGLDAAGKSTILYKINLGEVLTTIPTIGFNVETVQYKSLNMQIWDVGGQHKLRPLWRHYYQNTDAMIYVVDSADRERVEESKEELVHALADDALRGIPLLVFANKNDLPNAQSSKEVAKSLGLDTLRGRKWQVQSSCSITGEGLYEGMDWLSAQLKERKATA